MSAGRDFGFLERIVNDDRAIIFVRDEQGRYVWVNDNFTADLPVDADQLIGRTNREIFGVDAARGWETADAVSLAGGSFVITPEELYDRQRRKWRKFMSTKVVVTVGRQRYLAGVSIELLDESAVQYERKLAEFRAYLIERFGEK